MSYLITVKPSAQKELSKFPKPAIKKVSIAIDELKENPRPSGVKKLKSTDENLYRIRVGDYRILYTIEDTIQIVDITKVGYRKDIYK
jgi:mRNA interferase RelE/StbE